MSLRSTKTVKKANPNPLGKSSVKPRGVILGGLKKLKEKSNEQHKNTGPKPQPSVFHNKQQNITIKQPVLSTEDSDSYEYEYESESTETVDSENEDMLHFCKKMCKLTQREQESENEKKKRIESETKKFIKIRKAFLNEKMKDFRERVKSNSKLGKITLLTYKKDDVYEGHPIKNLLNNDVEGTGLKIILDKITPFRIFHFSKGVDNFVVEITWAAPPTKNPALKPNLIIKKKKRVKKSKNPKKLSK